MTQPVSSCSSSSTSSTNNSCVEDVVRKKQYDSFFKLPYSNWLLVGPQNQRIHGNVVQLTPASHECIFFASQRMHYQFSQVSSSDFFKICNPQQIWRQQCIKKVAAAWSNFIPEVLLNLCVEYADPIGEMWSEAQKEHSQDLPSLKMSQFCALVVFVTQPSFCVMRQQNMWKNPRNMLCDLNAIQEEDSYLTDWEVLPEQPFKTWLGSKPYASMLSWSQSRLQHITVEEERVISVICRYINEKELFYQGAVRLKIEGGEVELNEVEREQAAVDWYQTWDPCTSQKDRLKKAPVEVQMMTYPKLFSWCNSICGTSDSEAEDS